jgi:hypothetical protein
LFYDSSVRFSLAIILLGVSLIGVPVAAQDSDGQKQDPIKIEPKYDDTFSGAVIELTAEKVVVSRSILGKPAEKRTLRIQSDTRIEGKLHAKLKVTIGFVTSDEGDIARLIVVRPQKSTDKK